MTFSFIKTVFLSGFLSLGLQAVVITSGSIDRQILDAANSSAPGRLSLTAGDLAINNAGIFPSSIMNCSYNGAFTVGTCDFNFSTLNSLTLPTLPFGSVSYNGTTYDIGTSANVLSFSNVVVTAQNVTRSVTFTGAGPTLFGHVEASTPFTFSAMVSLRSFGVDVVSNLPLTGSGTATAFRDFKGTGFEPSGMNYTFDAGPAIPEPSTMSMAGIALVGALLVGRNARCNRA